MTSPDGITWTAQTGQSNFWFSVASDGSKFVAVDRSASAATTGVMTSAPGLSIAGNGGNGGNGGTVGLGGAAGAAGSPGGTPGAVGQSYV